MRQYLRLCLSLFALVGLQAKEAVGPTATFAIDRIVDVATAEYVNSAKTPQERSPFQNASNALRTKPRARTPSVSSALVYTSTHLKFVGC